VDLNDILLSTGLKVALSATTTSALAADTNNPGRSRIQISIASTPAQTESFVIYQISNTQFLVVELDSSQFGAGILEQQQ
jgi:hypothetical protein